MADGLFKRRRRNGDGHYPQWYMRYTDADGVSRTETTRCTDRRAAEQVRAERVRRVERVRAGFDTRDPRRSSQPIERAIDAYMAYVRPSAGPRWNDERERYIRNVSRDLRWRTAADINGADIVELLTAAGIGPQHYNNQRTALRGFTAWLLKHRYIETNPLEDMPRRPIDKDARQRGYWSIEDFDRLMVTPPTHRNALREWPRIRAAIAMAVYAHARRGSLVNPRQPERVVRVGHVRLDQANPVIEFDHNKERRRRVMPMVAPLRVAIEQYLPHRSAELGRVLRPDDALFGRVPRSHTIRAHLARCGLRTTDHVGRPLDFHGLGELFYYACRVGGIRAEDAFALGRHTRIETALGHYWRNSTPLAMATAQQLERAEAERAIAGSSTGGMGGGMGGENVYRAVRQSTAHHSPSQPINAGTRQAEIA